jgi:NAD(P)-dependent dehydrogenase (short-subunit alcohol dehydrogenase family)
MGMLEGSLDGKVALVTGAGSGIGRASALAFARAGARVVVSDVDEAGGKETADLVGDAGSEAVFVRADVTQGSDVEALVAAAVDAFGALDCAHNNAGISGPVAFTADLDPDTAHRILEVNLFGVFLCLHHEIRHMLGAGGGAIVNTASGAGLGGVPAFPAYSASKHGVVGLTKSAAVEYARQGIRVNAVCPGPIETPMLEGILEGNEALERLFVQSVPMGRKGTPEEVAELVVWLCSPAASYMNGAAVPVDGGSVAS